MVPEVLTQTQAWREGHAWGWALIFYRVLVLYLSPTCFCGFSKVLCCSWENTISIFNPIREALFWSFPEMVDNRCSHNTYVYYCSILRIMLSLLNISVFHLLILTFPPMSSRQFCSSYWLILPFPVWHTETNIVCEICRFVPSLTPIYWRFSHVLSRVITKIQSNVPCSLFTCYTSWWCPRFGSFKSSVNTSVQVSVSTCFQFTWLHIWKNTW